MATLLPLAATFLAAASLSLGQPPSPTKPAPSKPDAPKQPAKPAPKKPASTEPTLKVGSKAPAITADKWIKGAEVKSFEAGKVYVVEFWATWCPPCRESIPHLTKLAGSNKNLTIIGVASSERKPRPDGPDNRLANLEKFVTEQGDRIGYTIAYDASRAMASEWLVPAGKTTIPTAFVVSHEGLITHISNPLEKSFDTAVQKALRAAAAAPKPAAPTAETPPKTTEPKPNG